MNINLKRVFRATRAILVYTLVFGVIYTLVMTGIGQAVFSHRVNGSLVEKDGKVIASEYLSQPMKGEKYLQGRWELEDTESFPGHYFAGPTNQAVSYPEYQKTLQERAKSLNLPAPVGIDLVTGSGSGLDPNISLSSAMSQAPRIAKSRGLEQSQVEDVIKRHTAGNYWQPITNVLLVNLELDGLK
ncbi:hypothetical protein BK816_07425 [Boudabousia tangfeifanii]|uniref:Potassium-binding and translocating subunit C n=1 Tax=Boudabousia tangfeifanii TaxID=1912795 RepID=A0A1D9ML99_9ACTO|nr:potassium-transporting ATPase subunit C [Boudabousia tangfeifanii]AOZ73141.1 hypothetical protein BK816_07425 [Boudabousia tangfeifanii]